MPAGPGETCLTTLFADIHYYFAPPTSKPRHHRFSRGSYLYIFQNAAANTAKVEIANHAGTPDQDAFSGSLSNLARLSYSYNQPTLFTFTVDGASIQGHDQWHLPSFNEKNEQKYLYKIHTLDVYIWTEKDAAALLKHLKTVIPADRLELKDVPANLQAPAEHRDSMSPVVQQLEKTAIGAQFPPRSGSTTSAQSLPGPPTPATSIGGASQQSPQSAQAPAQAPMAYNPAAPAAPEARIHREKTPPPLDDGTGTGLGNAAKYDSVPQQQYANVPNTFQPSNQPTPQQSYFSGPPQQQQQPQQGRHPSMTSFAGPPQSATPPQRTASGSLPPPPPPPSGATSPPQQSYTPSFSSPPQQQQPSSPPPNQATFNRQSSYGGPPGQTQYARYNPAQRAPSFGPGAIASPGMPGGPPTPSAPPGYSSPGIPPPPSQMQLQPGQQQQQQQYQPGQQQQGQQQVFGYSNFSYSAQQNPQGYQPGSQYGYGGDMHQQLYRPTEQEAGAHGRPSQPQRQGSEQRNKLEGRVRDAEGKVSGYLKKLDKLW